jgi:hypothetical protein
LGKPPNPSVPLWAGLKTLDTGFLLAEGEYKFCLRSLSLMLSCMVVTGEDRDFYSFIGMF